MKHFCFRKSLLLFALVALTHFANANNMLVQNVTTLGNDPVNKTIQVQLDISWDNSWRDAINWDAAWIFMKFKNASGVWQHVQLNQTGFINGTGTANTLQVTSDKVGSWLYRSALGSGTFNTTGLQLQWNYGLAGLTSVTGLEVRVFAVEMVYVPEGDFNCAGEVKYNDLTQYASFFYSPYSASGLSRQKGKFVAPGNNFPVVNNKLSPNLEYFDGVGVNLRIKGDAGIDSNNDGVIDNTNYPTGFKAFYCYKYEMSEQQYSDFLNTLTAIQITNIGVAGSNISLSNGQYFSSTPNYALVYSNENKLFAYADWCGLRPMTFLEFNKASYGPYLPIFGNRAYPAGGNEQYLSYGGNVGSMATSTTDRTTSGATYYGILDFTGSAREPVVSLNYLNFTNQNGNGSLNSQGQTDILNWIGSAIKYIDETYSGNWNSSVYGFRYVRSAE
jgi:hypothetical protein